MPIQCQSNAVLVECRQGILGKLVQALFIGKPYRKAQTPPAAIICRLFPESQRAQCLDGRQPGAFAISGKDGIEVIMHLLQASEMGFSEPIPCGNGQYGGDWV